MIDFCRDNGIDCEAYSPIAHGDALSNTDIAAVADKYGVSVAQLCIRYTLELDMISLPKTVNPEYMKENIDVDFKISPEDMKLLKSFK